MGVLNLTAYKPVATGPGDATQISSGFSAIEAAVNGIDNNNFAGGLIFDPAKLMQKGAATGQVLAWDGAKFAPANSVTIPAGTAGQLLAYLGTTPTAVTPASASTTQTAKTVGAGPVMVGYGVAFTPTFSGRVLLAYSASSPSGGADSGSWQIGGFRYGTGSAPANGAALTGTQVGTALGGTYDTYGGANHHGDGTLNFVKVLTGLTVGVTYWIDLQASNIDIGAANLDVLEF